MSLLAFNDFTGGLNDTSSLDSLKDNELVVAQNIRVFKSGGASPRRGTEKLNSVSYDAEITQSFDWPLSDGSIKHMVMKDKSLYLSNSEGVLSFKKLLNSDLIGYVAYKDKLFFVDGSNYYVYGDFEFVSTLGTKTIALNDIVKNLGSTGGGIDKHFYRALAAHGSINLGTENYANETRWVDVTEGIVPDDIRPVPVDTSVVGADLSNIKKCTMLAFHQPSLRFFAAGNAENGIALYFSEPDNPYAFKAISELYPTTSSGPITGLQSFMSSMMISYKTTWRAWTGVQIGADAVWKSLPIPTGCLNHYSKCLTPYSMTFWGNDGLYVIYPGILMDETAVVVGINLFKKLDENKIETSIKSMTNPLSVRMTYFDGNVYIAYCDDGTGKNNKVLVMSFDLKTFVKDTGVQVNYWHVHNGLELWIASKNYILKTETGVNDIDVETGDYKGIHSILKSKPLSLGNFASAFLKKLLNYFYISARQLTTSEINSKITVSITSDYLTGEGSGDFNESLVWGRNWGKIWGFSDIVVHRMFPNKRAFRHTVKIESNEIDNDWFIYSLGFDYDTLDGSEAGIVEYSPTSHIVD